MVGGVGKGECVWFGCLRSLTLKETIEHDPPKRVGRGVLSAVTAPDRRERGGVCVYACVLVLLQCVYQHTQDECEAGVVVHVSKLEYTP